MSVDQMLACSDASDSEAEAGLPYSDSLGVRNHEPALMAWYWTDLLALTTAA